MVSAFLQLGKDGIEVQLVAESVFLVTSPQTDESAWLDELERGTIAAQDTWLSEEPCPP